MRVQYHFDHRPDIRDRREIPPRGSDPGPAPQRRWTSACGAGRAVSVAVGTVPRGGARSPVRSWEAVFRDLMIRFVVCLRTLFSSICFVRAEFPRAVAGHKPGAQRVTTQYCDFRGAILLPPPRCYAGQGGVGRARVTSGRRLCDALKPSSVARARQAAPTRSPSRQGSPATGA